MVEEYDENLMDWKRVLPNSQLRVPLVTNNDDGSALDGSSLLTCWLTNG